MDEFTRQVQIIDAHSNHLLFALFSVSHLGCIPVIEILRTCSCSSVSVRGQQPRPDVDGDPVQRDDLHPARLHPAGLLQNTVPGRDGEPRELLLWERYR